MTTTTQAVDMHQLAQFLGWTAAAFVAGLSLLVAAVRSWRRTVAPLLREIRDQAAGANAAVNNIGPKDQTLRQTVEHHARVLEEHTGMLRQILDVLTDPKR